MGVFLNLNEEDLTQIKTIIINFLHEHGKKPLLIGVPVTETSLDGNVRKDRDDVWFMGEWTLHVHGDKIRATWSYEWIAAEETELQIDLKKINNGFEILDWDVIQYF